MYDTKQELLASMVGKTLIEIVNNNNDELIFKCNDGTSYKMYHAQDCCESVTLEEIIGDLDDLIGHPLLVFEERTDPPEVESQSLKPRFATEWENTYGTEYEYECCTWTFYELRTIKGSVTLRWFGESNGYYSEEVDFVQEE